MDRIFFKPPTIQERKRDNPDDYEFLIADTAMDMINVNTVYTGEFPEGEHYRLAYQVHIDGIRNGMQMGTAIVEDSKILFWHPGKGEFVKYDKELQEYLLEFIAETRERIAGLREIEEEISETIEYQA